ncbi:hypothetical protein DP42_4664 [Burkholderia pseudomallei]|nr:hypothetical protein DO73_3503 [Burkholderia pseudomallei]KGD19538.1 hypothetical protein DP42_4664 [Burkholderia pseudomallei]
MYPCSSLNAAAESGLKTATSNRRLTIGCMAFHLEDLPRSGCRVVGRRIRGFVAGCGPYAYSGGDVRNGFKKRTIQRPRCR